MAFSDLTLKQQRTIKAGSIALFFMLMASVGIVYDLVHTSSHLIPWTCPVAAIGLMVVSEYKRHHRLMMD